MHISAEGLPQACLEFTVMFLRASLSRTQGPCRVECTPLLPLQARAACPRGPGVLFGVAHSADLTDSTRGGYESATEERVGAKDKNGMWPRSFHNNPFRKLLLLLKVISKKDTSVSYSIWQPCNAKLKSRTMARLLSSLLQVGA